MYSCVRQRQKRKSRDWDSTMFCDELPVCVCLSEKVLQWGIYDTPFTSAGASCFSFFIPLSLVGLWWWWRGCPSPLPLRLPWDEDGPPRPPEECCTLRSLFPSTRICGRKYKENRKSLDPHCTANFSFTLCHGCSLLGVFHIAPNNNSSHLKVLYIVTVLWDRNDILPVL